MKALVVDDDSSIRNIETVYLKKEGFEVIQASSGRRALSLFTSQKEIIAVVILDLN